MSGIVDGDFSRFPVSVSSHNTLRLLVNGEGKMLDENHDRHTLWGIQYNMHEMFRSSLRAFSVTNSPPAKTFCGARVYFIERCDNKQKLLTRTAAHTQHENVLVNLGA